MGYTVIFLLLLLDNFYKRKVMFRWKKIIDIIRYIAIYVLIISFPLDDKFFLILITTVSMISSIGQLFAYLKIKDRKQNENFQVILLSCTVELLVSMSLTYYTLYVINPDWFLISNISLNTIGERLFEFFYLTFSVVTTYSSGIIVLTGILPRLFQIIHTIIALTLLAKTFRLIWNKENDV